MDPNIYIAIHSTTWFRGTAQPHVLRARPRDEACSVVQSPRIVPSCVDLSPDLPPPSSSSPPPSHHSPTSPFPHTHHPPPLTTQLPPTSHLHFQPPPTHMTRQERVKRFSKSPSPHMIERCFSLKLWILSKSYGFKNMFAKSDCKEMGPSPEKEMYTTPSLGPSP